MDSTTLDRERWGGFAAMTGGLMALAVTPFFATSYLETTDEPPTSLVEAIHPFVRPFLEFATVDTVHQVCGRIYVIAALLMFVGFLALRAKLRDRLPGPGARGLSIALAGWVIALFGLVGDYVIGDTFGESFHLISFLMETSGILLLSFSAWLIGTGIRRHKVPPAWMAWPLILTLPVGFLGLVLIDHIPSGPMLGLNAAWIPIGYSLWAEASNWLNSGVSHHTLPDQM